MAQVSFNKFLDGLPLEHRKPVRYAAYNVITLCLLLVAYNVYLILNPYCKPLLWAILVGSILHPFKYTLSNSLKTWCNELRLSEISLTWAIFAGFLTGINGASMNVANKLLDDWKQVVTLVFFVFVSPWLYVIWLQTYTSEIGSYISSGQDVISKLLNLFQSHYVIAFIIAYLISSLFFWSSEQNGRIRKISATLWFPLSAYVASIGGRFRVPLFLMLQSLACLGYFLHLSKLRNKFKNDGIHLTFWGAVYISLANESELNASLSKSADELDLGAADYLSPCKSPNNLTSKNLDPLTPMAKSPWPPGVITSTAFSSPVEANFRFILKKSGLPEGLFLRKDVRPTLNLIGSSSYYFKGLFWACALVTLSKYTIIWPLLIFAVAYFCLHQAGVYFGIWQMAGCAVERVWSALKLRLVAVIPVQIQSINTVLMICTAYVREVVNESIDEISCFIVMFALLLFVTMASIFMIYQIYSEGMVMMQLFPTVLNNTKSLLPPSWDSTVELWMEDAYNYGRRGISSVAKSLLNDTSGMVEEHVLQLWDRIFQTWIVPEAVHGPNVDSTAIMLSWQSLLDIFQRSPDSLSMMTSLLGPVAEYTSIALGLLATFISMVVGGGTFLFNSLLNLLVFLTALFYLLSSSGSVYKPIEVISKLVPGTDLGEALSAAVDQVFIASFKMAVFYGLWVWLTHNFLGANIVFLPSAVAALLAVAPLIPPYLASIPAVLEICVLQGRPFAGITLFILQISPMLFGVDTAIYTEIKSGHPYLTCLSVAGGILYMGIEGALLGPLLLCWILCIQFSSSSVK